MNPKAIKKRLAELERKINKPKLPGVISLWKSEYETLVNGDMDQYIATMRIILARYNIKLENLAPNDFEEIFKKKWLLDFFPEMWDRKFHDDKGRFIGDCYIAGRYIPPRS